MPQKPLLLRFKTKDQILFSKRLSMMLRSGIQLGEGIAMISINNASSSANYVFASIANSISEGRSLSMAFESLSGVFGSFSINIIRVGEVSGRLYQNLDYLSEELKKREALKKKIVGALAYPIIITIATLVISLALATYIFPKILPVFQSFRHQLPLSTRILMSVSNVLTGYWVWLLCIGFVAAILIVFLLRILIFRRIIDRILLRLPIIGRLLKSYTIANTSRTLSLLLQGDVRIVPALKIVADSTENISYRESLHVIGENVSRGILLSQMLTKFPHLFPLLTSQVVSAGEKTGDLAGSLMYVAEMYEDELDDITKNLTTLLEPFLMIVMGVLVGFVAISIIQPIYGITQDLTPH